MGRPISYRTPPATPINQWVRDALAFSGHGFAEMARLLEAEGIGSGDRSIVQKMTTNRGVKAPEMLAISKITGFPLPMDRGAFEDLARVQDLSPENRARLSGYLDALVREEAGGGGP